MPTVTATVTLNDEEMPDYSRTLQISDELEAGIIGLAVKRAVEKAWQAGNDPAQPRFAVVVRFN